MRRKIILAVALLSVISGCSSFTDLSPNLGQQVTNTPDGSVSSPQLDGINSSTNQASQIILSLPEVGGGYNLTAQSVENLNETESRETRFGNPGVEQRHERVYASVSDTSEETSAELIYSSVVLFRSERLAQSGLTNFLSVLPSQNKSITETEITNGLRATRVTYQQGDSEHNTLVIKQQDAMIYFVVTSDTRSYQIEQTESLFFEMVVDR
jgi:hypothetical protein